MFDALPAVAPLDEARLERAVSRLRADLLDAQYSILEQGRTPVVLLIAGVAGAGRGRLVNTLNEWMDPVTSAPALSGRATRQSGSARTCGATGRRCRRVVVPR